MLSWIAFVPHGLARVRGLAGLSLGALLLAGCASTGGLTPQVRPTDAQDLAVQHTLAHEQVQQAWPAQDWWTVLNDPQLNALMQEALAHNPDLATADARVREANAQANAANADRFPQVSASGGSSGIRIPTTVIGAPYGGGYSTLWHGSLNVSYTLDLWGGQKAAYQAALGQAAAASIDAQAARLSLSSAVAQTYLALSQAFDEQDVAEQNVARTAQALGLTHQRVTAGLDGQTQVQQAETSHANAVQRRLAAQHQVELEHHALAALLGAGPDRGERIDRPRTLTTVQVGVPSVIPSELLGRRPDVVAARWRVLAAQRSVASAKTQFYPNLNLSAAAGLASLGLSDLVTGGARYEQLGTAISMPVFDAGKLRANLDAQDAQEDQAVAAYNQALVKGLNQVVDELTAVRSLDQQVQQASAAQVAASTAERLAMQRYRSGVGGYLDVLTTQEAVLTAQEQWTSLVHARATHAVLLTQALGGGLRLDVPLAAQTLGPAAQAAVASAPPLPPVAPSRP